MTKCNVNNCRKEADLTWLGHQICNDHWSKHCDDKIDFDLYHQFGIAKPKMSEQLRSEIEKTEKIRKDVDKEVNKQLEKSKKIDEQKTKESNIKRQVHRTGNVIKDIRAEFTTGNFNFSEIATKTGANPTTVKTQWYRWKKENKTTMEVATNGKESPEK